MKINRTVDDWPRTNFSEKHLLSITIIICMIQHTAFPAIITHCFIILYTSGKTTETEIIRLLKVYKNLNNKQLNNCSATYLRNPSIPEAELLIAHMLLTLF